MPIITTQVGKNSINGVFLNDNSEINLIIETEEN